MKKRSAFAIAGGLALVVLASTAAMSLGLTGGTTATTSAASAGSAPPPRARTIERTVTVHKEAKADSTPVVRTVVAPATRPGVGTTAATSSSDDWSDDDYEEHEDDEFEREGDDEDHEDGDEDGHEDQDEHEGDDD